VEDGDNPLAQMGGMEDGQCLWNPLVWHWAKPPIESVFLPVQDDLVQLALETDLAWSLVQYLANTQSHGQPVMIGSGTLPQALGASSVVRIDDPGGDFKFAAPTADVRGLLEVIRALYQTHAMLRHLSPDSWSFQRPSIQTGPAKQLEQAGLFETRSRRTLMADQWEARRFGLERLYLNYFANAGIPWDMRQTVHWGELRVPVDRGAQVQRLLSEKALGVASQLDAVMEVWSLSREDAQAKLTEINAANTAKPAQAEPGRPIPNPES
jgi:hypothetical protein